MKNSRSLNYRTSRTEWPANPLDQLCPLPFLGLCGALLICCALLLSAALPAKAAVIASVDFDGRTVSGATASNLTWNLNGVANPGDLTASHNLFNTTDAQDLFAVDRNLHREGSSSVDIPLNVLDSAIELGNVTLNVYPFSNSGTLQVEERNLDLTLELRDTGLLVIETVFINDIYTNLATPPVYPQFVTFVFSETLTANTSYTLRLIASGSGPGANNGFDDLTINGTLLSPPGGGGNPFGPGGIPEPSRAVLLMLGAVAVTLRRRR